MEHNLSTKQCTSAEKVFWFLKLFSDLFSTTTKNLVVQCFSYPTRVWKRSLGWKLCRPVKFFARPLHLYPTQLLSPFFVLFNDINNLSPFIFLENLIHSFFSGSLLLSFFTCHTTYKSTSHSKIPLLEKIEKQNFSPS